LRTPNTAERAQTVEDRIAIEITEIVKRESS
jgi:hypothetical protein